MDRPACEALKVYLGWHPTVILEGEGRVLDVSMACLPREAVSLPLEDVP